MKTTISNTSQRGLTLIEVMIAVAVIGLISAIAIPNLRKHIELSRIQEATARLELIEAAVNQLAWDTGRWPGAIPRSIAGDAETWDLATANAGLLSASPIYDPYEWRGPYIDEIPEDPWGHPYFFDPDYRVDGVNRAVIGSFGPNGIGRNVYDEDNIVVIVK